MKFLILCLLLVGCTREVRLPDGNAYECYGPFNRVEFKKENVEYEASGLNIFTSIILSETLVIPVWLVGFNLNCPIALKTK